MVDRSPSNENNLQDELLLVEDSDEEMESRRDRCDEISVYLLSFVVLIVSIVLLSNSTFTGSACACAAVVWLCYIIECLSCSAALFESRIRQCTTFYRHHRAKPLLMIVLPCSLITQYVCFITWTALDGMFDDSCQKESWGHSLIIALQIGLLLIIPFFLVFWLVYSRNIKNFCKKDCEEAHPIDLEEVVAVEQPKSPANRSRVSIRSKRLPEKKQFDKYRLAKDWLFLPDDDPDLFISFFEKCLGEDFPHTISQLIFTFLVEDFNWEAIAKREQIQEMKQHTKRLLCLRLDRTDKCLYSCGQDKVLKVWEVETGTCLKTFTGHQNNINCIIFNLDYTCVLTAASDNTAKMWDIDSGRCLKTFRGHADTLWGIHLYQNDERLVTCSTDTTIRLWDVESTDQIKMWKDPDGHVYNMDITLDQQTIYTGGKNGTCKKWDLTTGNLHTVYTKHDDYVQVLFLTKDAMKMVSGSRDHTMIVWNTKTADRIHTLRGHNQCVRDLTLTNDDEYLFSIGDDGKWIVWDMETGNKLLKREIYKTDGTCCRLSSDETRFYTGSEGCDIKMWYLKDLKKKFKFK